MYTLYFILEYIGVGLAAVVGGQIAKRMDFDLIGFTFIALISALAGGVLRDTFLNDGPAAALQTPGYLITAVAGAVIAYFLDFKAAAWGHFRFYADITTVGVWAVVGVTRGLDNELGWVSCILLGVITAVGGSLVRDVVLGKVPSLFTSQKMYVIPAVLASVLMLGFDRGGLIWQGMLVAPVVASISAMALYWFGAYTPKQSEYRSVHPLLDTFAARAGRRPDSRDELAQMIRDTSDEELVSALREYFAGKAMEENVEESGDS